MNKYLTFKIDYKLMILLILSFILATIIGTLSHEFGHYLGAKYVGINATIHYGYTNMSIPDDFKGNFGKFDRFLITLGGPIQTISFGMTGLLLLYFNRNKIKTLDKLKAIHWVYVFLSLFWLRQTTNFVTWITKYFMYGRFSKRMDEVRLARNLDLPDWSIIFPTAIIGCLITFYVIFKYIPINQRFTFIISGLLGGCLGYYLWLYLLGKIIMP